MSFGGFLENSTGGGGAARVVVDIPYSNGSGNNHHNMPSGALVQSRLVTPPLTKSMFNSSPGLSLGLVRPLRSLSLYDYHLFLFLLFLNMFLFSG
jgi:homeobox-leucine zipper protein